MAAGLCIIRGVAGFCAFADGGQWVTRARTPRVRTRRLAAIAAFRPDRDK